jgi:hypothetical protein
MPTEHVVIPVAVATVVAITRLIAYAINDDKRWPRFRNLALFVVILAMVVAAGWWLLAGGGLQVLLHGIGRRSRTETHPSKAGRLVFAGNPALAAVGG